MWWQPVSASELLDNPRAAADGVACTVIPPANATIVTSTSTRRSIASIRSRYAGHPEISTVHSWLLDGGLLMNDGFGTRTAVRFPWSQSPLSAQPRRPDASRRRAGIHRSWAGWDQPSRSRFAIQLRHSPPEADIGSWMRTGAAARDNSV